MDKKISAAIKELFDIDINVAVTRPEPQFGDYATNVALQLAKPLGKNPREIANSIAEKLRSNEEFGDVSVAGAGFINIRVSDLVLKTELDKILAQNTTYGSPNIYANKIVVTEYSDPNPFKVLHAGHLYTSIVGDVISNLIEVSGGRVHRVNFGGDVGLHVGKTMYVILQRLHGENPERLSDIPEDQRSQWMAECYVEGTNLYEDDEKAKAEIVALNKRVYQLHSDNDHDSNFAQIYWTCRQWSYDYFDEFYGRIGSKFERYYPESETATLGLEIVRKHIGEVFEKSDGAVVFKGEDYGLHTRVFINREGIPTYEAKDVGLIMKKYEDYRFDKSVVITGNEQAQYMSVVLKAVEQFAPELAQTTTHLTHGLVKLAGGVKMSSRKGNILRARDVLEAAADANETAHDNRNDAPVLGAVKYSFLKNRMGGDIIYDPNESVSLQGNSGPYLQYTLARAFSIARKSDKKDDQMPDNFEDGERALIAKLTEYPEVIVAAAVELAPHYICTYLYELAQTFNRFYEKNQVIGDEREALRARLVTAYAIVLKNGLTILGIPTPEKM